MVRLRGSDERVRGNYEGGDGEVHVVRQITRGLENLEYRCTVL